MPKEKASKRESLTIHLYLGGEVRRKLIERSHAERRKYTEMARLLIADALEVATKK